MRIGDDIRVDDVVQIDGDDSSFAACFLVVTEVKGWGVVGYVVVPDRPKSAQAFYRAPFERIVKIGAAEWTTKREEPSTP